MTMNHAEQVVAPVRQAPGTAVAQGNKFQFAQTCTQLANFVVGDVPYHHGVGTVTQFVMAHHYTHALDNAQPNQVGP